MRKEFYEEMILKMYSEIWTGVVQRKSILGKEKSVCKGLEVEKKHGALEKQKAEGKAESEKGWTRGSQSAIPSSIKESVRNANSQASLLA